MKHEYPLAALMRVRTAARDAAEVALGRRQKAVHAVEGQLKHAEGLRQSALLEIMEHQGRDPTCSEVSGITVAMRREYVLAKKGEVAALLGRCDDLKEELRKYSEASAKAKSLLMEAMGELEVLQKHHTSWIEERRKKRESFEVEEAEEVAAVVWRSRNDQD